MVSVQNPIQHGLDIDFQIRPYLDAKLSPEEGRARQIRGWGLGGLCLINVSQDNCHWSGNDYTIASPTIIVV